MNLAEAFEQPVNGPVTAWRWLQKEETYYMLKNAGFTAVRVAIDFSIHSDHASPFEIDPAFWAAIDSAIEKAIACQLIAIVDMHWFNGSGHISPAQEDHFLALWTQIAQHYQDYPNEWLYFELFNEPDAPAYWNQLLAKSLAVVRFKNPTRPVIVGAVRDVRDLELPEDPNLIVSFHYYRPERFTAQCNDFFPGAMDWCGTEWQGTPDQVAAIELTFDAVARWATRNKRPIFMGEFGSWSAADRDSRVRWTTAVRTAAEDRDFSWGYFTLCSRGPQTFGIFDCSSHPPSLSDWQLDLLRALNLEPCIPRDSQAPPDRSLP